MKYRVFGSAGLEISEIVFGAGFVGGILLGDDDAVKREAINFMVSCHGAERYRADIVRLLSPEAGPDAPPYREEVVDLPVNGDYPGRVQEIDIGSWAYVPASPVIDALQGFTIQAFIWPTLPGSGSQALLGAWSENEGRGFGLFLNEAGALEGQQLGHFRTEYGHCDRD